MRTWRIRHLRRIYRLVGTISNCCYYQSHFRQTSVRTGSCIGWSTGKRRTKGEVACVKYYESGSECWHRRRVLGFGGWDGDAEVLTLVLARRRMLKKVTTNIIIIIITKRMAKGTLHRGLNPTRGLHLGVARLPPLTQRTGLRLHARAAAVPALRVLVNVVEKPSRVCLLTILI